MVRVTATTAKYVHELAETLQVFAGQIAFCENHEWMGRLEQLLGNLTAPPDVLSQLFRDRLVLLAAARILLLDIPAGIHAVSFQAVLARLDSERSMPPRGASVAPPASALQLRDWLDGHFEERFSIRALGDLWHISPRRMAADFRLAFGVAPAAYVTTLRVERASDLVRCGVKIEAAAKLAGISKASLYRHVTHPNRLRPKASLKESQKI